MNVELRNIYKTFGTLHANNGISLDIPAGTIQGILGENGAGKSTLMKILSGFYQPTRGEILLDGQAVTIHSPADAIRHGVGMLHQDPLDFPAMQVSDNFLLGQGGGLLPNRKQAVAALQALQGRLGFSLSPAAYVDSLTVGERQQLEILRLLWLGARVLILDEPTTGISASQKEKLFAALKLLIQEGKTIVFVSHKLEDVEQLCDKIAVLRQGALVGEMAPPYVTAHLVTWMFDKVVTLGERLTCGQERPVLSVRDLALEDSRLYIESIKLDVCAGEVIGLAGMEGSGQALFLRACAGLVRPVAGALAIAGHDMTGKAYHRFRQRKVAYLPASRLEEGLAAGMTLTEHFVLAEESDRFLVDWKQGEALARQRIAEFNIRGQPYSTVEALSGGNQQRALLALLQTPLSLILLEHPTRGLDIESTIYLWGKLKERCAREGTAIIFISADLDELLQYSDRLLVFFSGKVSPPLDAATTSVAQLGQFIGGKGWERSCL
ncbi:MAG: ABC transporter ATP-binding protein [Chloroflexota bacterium]